VAIAAGGSVTASAVAPDGSWLASASNHHQVRIWDPAAGVPLHTLTGHTDSVTALAVAPDGSWLASASDAGEIADLVSYRRGVPHSRPRRCTCRRDSMEAGQRNDLLRRCTWSVRIRPTRLTRQRTTAARPAHRGQPCHIHEFRGEMQGYPERCKIGCNLGPDSATFARTGRMLSRPAEVGEPQAVEQGLVRLIRTTLSGWSSGVGSEIRAGLAPG
jgi:hypothetical protein